MDALVRPGSSILLVALIIAACSSDHTTGTTQVATKLAFTVEPPSSVAAAGNFSIVVAIEDQTGNVVTSATNSVTLSGANSSGSVFIHGYTATTISAVQGLAKFDSMEINNGGAVTLTASGTGLTSATSTPLTITPGPPYKFAFLIQPSTTPLGSTIPAFSAAVEDVFGNTVTADTTHIALIFAANPTGAKLSGNTYVVPVNGVATFTNLSIDRPGHGYELYAQGNAAQNAATSNPFDITLTFTSVSAGDQHTCAIATSGKAWCWGFGYYGQLGDSNSGYTPLPAAVADDLVFASLSAGELHSCGVTGTGAAYCWGYNGTGALGNGTTSGSGCAVPCSVEPLAVSGSLTFASVSATGGNTAAPPYPGFTCGVTTANADYCWGDNASGELGNDTTAGSTTPVAVSGGLSFASVSAGGGPDACGLTTAGAAYCWGDNTVGELGTGDTAASKHPIAVSGSLVFAAVSDRNGHACGVTTSGSAYCWGWNNYGQLGDSTNTGPQICTLNGSLYACSRSPVAVSGGLTFASISSGWSHTCGLTTSGDAYCWGYNTDGELGNGSTANSSTPVPVSGGLKFVALSSGSAHTCGLTAAGAIYCWGANAWGELGNGGYGAGVASLVPTRVLP